MAPGGRGTAPSRVPVDYIIAGESGQTLAASVRESDPVTLHLYGLDDGEQLAPLPERRRLWAGRLPATQDYVVSVVPADEGEVLRQFQRRAAVDRDQSRTHGRITWVVVSSCAVILTRFGGECNSFRRRNGRTYHAAVGLTAPAAEPGG